jgi:hypothetical protein
MRRPGRAARKMRKSSNKAFRRLHKRFVRATKAEEGPPSISQIPIDESVVAQTTLKHHGSNL